MEEKELQDLFKQLEQQGLNPMLCDTPIKSYDAEIACGEPMFAAEPYPDEIYFPKKMLSMQPEFTVLATGDSMIGAGITEGDTLKIAFCGSYNDGDIVFVSIDDEYTIKTYCEDEDGKGWLVPQNNKYKPICLHGRYGVRIIGKVKEIIKPAPRVSYRECIKLINKAKAEANVVAITEEERVKRCIQEIAPDVEILRQWFAVYRPLVDCGILDLEDYFGFCKLVEESVPEHDKKPNTSEMQRMAVGSFTKTVSQWNEKNAPVQGKRFNEYLRIAKKMTNFLTNT